MNPSVTKKIMVVDDSASAADAVRQMLASDYIVKVCMHGEQALSMFPRFKPDIVLLDVEMPLMDGYQVCRKIRDIDTQDYVKIIMVSVKSALRERLKGYDVGADDYIVKPFKPEELMAKLRVFFRIQTLEKQLRKLNDELNEQVRIRTEQLIDAEKMAAIGRYAAGIVHNLNSPLQAILGISQILGQKYPDSFEIELLNDGAVEMKRIIRSILNATHKENRYEDEALNLNKIVEAQIELYKVDMFFKHDVRLQTELNPLPLYYGNYVHFSQSIGNLIKNAIEAMHETRDPMLKIKTINRNGEIHIQITDNGHGIPEGSLVRIFDPFYTTKPLSDCEGRPTGTGLGLASTKEMIESYGGSIEVRSGKRKGTTFTVKLPKNSPQFSA